MNDAGTDVRGLPPPLYGVLCLPGGLSAGFITVTLGYVLGRHGVDVGSISGIVGLGLLPSTWKFLIGPVLDMSLSSRTWYMICIVAKAACLAAFALLPLSKAEVPTLGLLAFAMGVATNAAGSSITAAMALTTPKELRGAVAGWVQTGNLGGVGIGGGAGLWIASHFGGAGAAALTLAPICLLCAAPMLWMRVPLRPQGVPLPRQALDLGAVFFRLVRSRGGVLAMLAVTLPAALGAATNLLPASASSWRASADLVAIVTGVLGGLASVPGCLIGGYLCDRFPRRIVYMWGALICAAGEALMAVTPHTPELFAGFILGNALLLGVAWAAVSAVIYECLGASGAATIGAILSSLCNLPVVVVTVLVGWVQTRYGSSAMLLTEAGLGVLSVAGYAALAWVWRPDASGAIVALAPAE